MSGSHSLALSQRFLEARFFPSLDALRALSIVPVIFHHATPRPLPGLLGRGPIGVDLFFAISGFLITTLLVRERQAFGQIALGDFYGRRACRIFPIYYLGLLLHALYALVIRPDSPISQHFVPLLPYYATYTANWLAAVPHAQVGLFAFAWSLCTEEQFYALWAPTLRFARRLRHAALAMALWVLFDLLLEHLGAQPKGSVRGTVTVIVTSFASPIGFGALLSLGVHQPTLLRLVGPLLGHRMSAPVVFAITIALILWPVLPLFCLHLVLALLVGCCALRRDHGLSFLLDREPVYFVGRISYGIYLWHVPVLCGLRLLFPPLGAHPFWLFSAGLPLSVGVAFLSYRVIEQPCLRLGQRWFARRVAGKKPRERLA